MNPAYRNRREAGQSLGVQVRERVRASDAVVLALPRGGVPVGIEVARALHAPLDIFVVRKLGVPAQPGVTMGAITGSGFEILNEALIAQLGLSRFQIAAVADRETEELHRREVMYRRHRSALSVRGRTVVVVDDGLATGVTLRAAIGALRLHDPSRIIVAVPVGAAAACHHVETVADAFVCPLRADPFHGLGHWYDNFAPTTDDEVRDCLGLADRDAVSAPTARTSGYSRASSGW